jgi:hypothetical protein
MLLVAIVAAAAPGFEIIPWGLGLSTATVAILVADIANRLAGGLSRRSERKRQRAIAEAAAREEPVRLTSFRDWLNEKDQQRSDSAA